MSATPKSTLACICLLPKVTRALHCYVHLLVTNFVWRRIFFCLNSCLLWSKKKKESVIFIYGLAVTYSSFTFFSKKGLLFSPSSLAHFCLCLLFMIKKIICFCHLVILVTLRFTRSPVACMWQIKMLIKWLLRGQCDWIKSVQTGSKTQPYIMDQQEWVCVDAMLRRQSSIYGILF